MCVKAELCQAKQREAEHRVVITEYSSAQFPTWIFNFGPYGQLNAVRENSSIKLKYMLLFHVFVDKDLSSVTVSVRE